MGKDEEYGVERAMTVSTVKEISNCCGCRACTQVCPQKCITFRLDKEGFAVPEIDEKKCVKCGLCYKYCGQKGYERFHEVQNTYAAIHNEKEILMGSTSGGGMTAIAEQIIADGGVVYGTYIDTKDWNVKFRYAQTLEELGGFRGSKYVQSDTGRVFTEITDFLAQNRKVLFVGTPCQVAGLYMVLGGDNLEHLFTIDLLCHGVPSPDLFVEHVKYLESKYRRKLLGFSFRDKSWFPNKAALKYQFDNGHNVCILGRCELYYNSFISGIANRECCYDCQYAREKRVGDITLGDYWGISKVHPNFDNSSGVSLILANTEKGNKLVRTAKMRLLDSDLDSAAQYNGMLLAPPERAGGRDSFYEDIKTFGYEKAIKKHVKTYPMIYNWILTHLPHKLIKALCKAKNGFHPEIFKAEKRTHVRGGGKYPSAYIDKAVAI